MLRAEALDHLDRDAGVLRTPGSGRDDDAIGRIVGDLVERQLVVAADDRRRAQLAQVLGEVEGERIVVVDQQNHSPASAIASACSMRPRLVARLLVLGRRVRVGDDAGAGLHVGARRRGW